MLDRVQEGHASAPADLRTGDGRRHVRQRICFLVDQDPGARRIISSVMDSCRLGCKIFDSIDDLTAAAARIPPDLIVVDLTIGLPAAIESVERLGRLRPACPVVLLSGLNPLLTEEVRRRAARAGVSLLHVVPKPFRASAMRSLISHIGLGRAEAPKVTLRDIIKDELLELWYQPKIDLKSMVMVGAEAFIRARHPDHGVLTPDVFLPDADESDLLDLTRRVLCRALQDAPQLSPGRTIELSINVPVCSLTKLSIFGLLWEQRPNATNGPGLVLELSEDEIVPNLSLAYKAIAELRPFGISIAVDDFGSSYAELSRLKSLPFSEIKIDRTFLADCDIDPMNAGLCETLIEFARKYDIKSVAEGIETKGELATLQRLGCDLGQGYRFAAPMPKSELMNVVRSRHKEQR